MAWSIVQKVANAVTANGSTAVFTSLLAATGTGHLIVVMSRNNGGANISAVSDDAPGGSNSYIHTGIDQGSTVAGQRADIWYCLFSSPGAKSVTISVATSVIVAATVYEVAAPGGIAVFDTSLGIDDQTASTTPLGATVTTATVGEFIASLIAPSGGATVSSIFGGNEFTNDFTQSGSGWAHITSTSATAASHQAQWNMTSGGFCSSAAAWKFTLRVILADEFAIRHFGP